MAQLTAGLLSAQREALERRGAAPVPGQEEEPGIFLEFEAPPGVDLKLQSLESKRSGIELVGVTEVPTGSNELPVQKATVFVPEGKLAHFLGRFETYAEAVLTMGLGGGTQSGGVLPDVVEGHIRVLNTCLDPGSCADLADRKEAEIT